MSGLLINAIDHVHLRTWYMMHFLSSRVSRICQLSEMDRESRECNHLWVLIGLLGYDKKWHWKHISCNALTTRDRIVQILDNPELLCKFTDHRFELNPNIDLNDRDLIARIRNTLGWKDSVTHARPDYVIRGDEEWKYIIFNPRIPINLILKYRSHICEPLTFRYVSIPDAIRLLPNYNEAWCHLSDRADINTILQHPEIPWDWVHITRNATLDVIEKYPNLPWVRSELKYNPQMTSEFASKMGVNIAVELIAEIPKSILRKEGIYRTDWNANDYKKCKTFEFYAKYPSMIDERPLNKCTGDYRLLKGLISKWDYWDLCSKLAKSWRDIISDIDHDQLNPNLEIISENEFGHANSLCAEYGYTYWNLAKFEIYNKDEIPDKEDKFEVSN